MSVYGRFEGGFGYRDEDLGGVGVFFKSEAWRRVFSSSVIVLVVIVYAYIILYLYSINEPITQFGMMHKKLVKLANEIM